MSDNNNNLYCIENEKKVNYTPSLFIVFRKEKLFQISLYSATISQ